LNVPFVLRAPRAAPEVAGVGDLAIGSKVRVVQSVEHTVLASLGFDLGLPTGP
jgi:hypothetical protein